MTIVDLAHHLQLRVSTKRIRVFINLKLEIPVSFAVSIDKEVKGKKLSSVAEKKQSSLLEVY